MGWLLANLVSSTVMTGLIWFVQIVHYPLFAHVGDEESVSYANEHQRRTSYVVGAPMAVEGVSSLALFALAPEGISRWWALVGLVLLAVVLGSTVLLQVPAHARLAQNYDDKVVKRLVRSNWIRTVGWTLRCGLAAGLVIWAATNGQG